MIGPALGAKVMAAARLVDLRMGAELLAALVVSNMAASPIRA